MKKKNLFLAVLAVGVLASCSNDEFVGNTAGIQTNPTGTISFGGGTAAMTRADFTGSDAATKLGNAMKVYGVKQNSTTTTNYDKVFVDYSVKYDAAKSANDEYNQGWYYVGAESNQVIKYWDYSSADYHFVAGSPVANFTYALNSTTGDIETATVTGLGGHLNHSTKNTSAEPAAVYIADPKVVAKANYKQEVEFTFRSLQTKVRVGIYETIPGYKITDIQFYNNEATPVASNYITLNGATAGYFQGSTNATGVVTYNWGTPAYTFAYTAGIHSGNYWEGGQFTAGVPAINSAATNLYGSETDMASNGYFIVMPTPSATTPQDLTLTCDYTLTSLDGSGETIKVTGATATIPSDYTKWVANTAYTYIFKISKDTNGTTGEPGTTDPAGLYPIVFDAVVVNVADQQIGTETTVSTPSITCYQNGDVVENGITFVAGTDIIIKVNEASDILVKRLSGDFDYTKSYDAQAYDGAQAAFNGVTEATLSNPAGGKTYVIKATTASSTAYFVLVVGAAENGPANP